MDFHSTKSLGLRLALFLGLAAPVPALLGLVVGLTAPQLFGAAALWLLAALAVGSALFGAGLGAWIGAGLEGPLRRWAKVSERAVGRGEIVEDSAFADYKGLLGELARHAKAGQDRFVERSRARAALEAAAQLATAEAAAAAEVAAALEVRRLTARAATMEALVKMAQGEVTHRVTTEYTPEGQDLKDNLNRTLGHLNEAIEAVHGPSASICAGTDELSRSCDELAKRTERQAARLEETAAAVGQITQAVRRTADGAAGARSVVQTATDEAVASEKVVADAVDAMSGIERSAQQISQIIGVIDEIAFQTNLLALNAGVEAARAGEAGRGFAVVATEVRALAQRSADAAKEIKQLIHTSTGQVNTGVQLVGATGKALRRILGKVTEINGMVLAIAASAETQALGLQEVNVAIREMDQVTQQNSAMAQESTAACLALASEAAKLGQAISHFNLGHTGAAVPTARAAWTPAPLGEPAANTQAFPSPARALHRRALQAFGAAAPVEDAGWEEF